MSLLIKGVQVVDGEGSPPYKADVLVQKNIISAIGELKRKRAEREIDGLGHYLAPGFIDINTDSDHYLSLFTNPAQSDFINQGVTTIIGGHCGASLAPLLYGTLESIRKWVDPEEINVNWHTTAEFLKTLEKLPLGVNFGTLAGHSTIRRALIGESNRRLTLKELAVFEQVLRQALEEGAFGLSTGLGYVHGRQASDREITALVKKVASWSGVYTTHLRNETDELLDSVKETIKIAEETGAKTIISHLRPLKGFEKQFEETLKLLEKSAASANVYFDIYPYDTSIQAVYTLLPIWAEKANLETMLELLSDEELMKLIKKSWQDLELEGIRVASAPHHPYFIGKTLKEMAEDSGTSPAESLIRLMTVTGLRATVFNPNINEEYLRRALLASRALIASNGNSPAPGVALKHERTTNTFPKYLELAVKENQLPIEAAVKRITAEPAQYFGLKKRGMVKEGYLADLVILGKSDYQVREVFLGGKTSREESRGEVLRHTK